MINILENSISMALGDKMPNSEITGFYKKTFAERLQILQDFSGLSESELEQLQRFAALDLVSANRMIENVVGSTQLPLGIATNFKINNKDYLIPMAIEEPSVVAGASKAAKLARQAGGFTAKASKPVMIGQIQLVGLKNIAAAKIKILKEKKKILKLANSMDEMLVKRGGGANNIELRSINYKKKKFLVLHLLVDVRDAMGANAVNTMCEAIAPLVEEISGGKVRLKILSNLSVYRTVKVKAMFPEKLLGKETIRNVLDAYEFAAADVYRATTHNKGIMNGVDAVLLATGNDWRAVEAGAHAYASLSGKYSPLTKYSKNKNGDLVAELEMPLAVGTVGGATCTHPIAQIAMKILGVRSAQQLSEVIASVGLAQNFAAILALSTEGIQRGHMRLHAKNIAVAAGAKDKLIDIVAERMIKGKRITVSEAARIVKELK